MSHSISTSFLVFKVVKKIWAHIKANELQNPKDKRKIIVDDVLGTFLSSPVNMMSMNKQLTKHIFTKGAGRCKCLLVSMYAVLLQFFAVC